MKILTIVFACCVTLALSACGQVGPLYLPGQKPPVYIPPPHTNKSSTSENSN